uniref:Uncharacterized protein n=1 Tax=Cucumis melo TaxID=3656 RepID=A0A9I9CCN9_CUCME
MGRSHVRYLCVKRLRRKLVKRLRLHKGMTKLALSRAQCLCGVWVLWRRSVCG